jgi:hypothetical protein
MTRKRDNPMVRLSDVADVFVGTSTMRKEGGDAQEVRVLQVGDIDDRTGGARPLKDLNLMPLPDKSGLDRYRVQPGDVVVSCKGTLLKTGLIEESTAGAIASANLVVVRARGDVSPKTLYLVLRSEGAKRKLKGLQKVGATIASLSYKDIQTLEFRLPNHQTQVRIASLLDTHREYQELTLKAVQIREEMVNGLVEKAIWGDSSTGGER